MTITKTATTPAKTTAKPAQLLASCRKYYAFISTRNPSLKWDSSAVIVQWLQIRSELVAHIEAFPKGVCMSYEGKDFNGSAFLRFVNSKANSTDRATWLKSFKASC